MAQPYVPVAGTLQVNIRFLLAGQVVENVLAFQYGGTPFGTAVGGLNTIIQNEWWVNVRGALGHQIVHVENYYTDLSDQAGPVASRGAFTNPAGAHSSPAASNNVAFVITHRTANRGKSYRGRTYMAGLAMDFLHGNTVDPNAIAAFELGFESLRAACAAALVPFVVVSRIHNKLPRIAGLATVVTSSIARDNRIDTQRGRLPS